MIRNLIGTIVYTVQVAYHKVWDFLDDHDEVKRIVHGILCIMGVGMIIGYVAMIVWLWKFFLHLDLL